MNEKWGLNWTDYLILMIFLHGKIINSLYYTIQSVTFYNQIIC